MPKDVTQLPPRRLGHLPLMAPIWLTLGGLFVLPLLGILALSFAATGLFGFPEPIEDLPHLWRHITSGDFLDQYRRTFGPTPLAILWRSLWVAVVTTVLTALIAYPAAYFIAVRASPRWRNLLLILAVLPFWTSFVVRTYAWTDILGREGLINRALLAIGAIDQPLTLLYTEFAVTLGLVYGELPFMILPLYASLEKLDRSLLEASADLGGGAFSTFWRVTFPLSLPGLMAGAVLVFIPSVGQFVVSDLLGGSKGMLVGNLIRDQFGGASGGNRPYGAALAIQLSLVVLLLVGLYARWVRRRNDEVLL
jgi:spermidine/putrescine transport system permease protein